MIFPYSISHRTRSELQSSSLLTRKKLDKQATSSQGSVELTDEVRFFNIGVVVNLKLLVDGGHLVLNSFLLLSVDETCVLVLRVIGIVIEEDKL